MTFSEEKIVLSSQDIKRILYRLSHQVLEKTPNLEKIVLLGIQTRGAHLACRIQKIIKEIEGSQLPLGVLDITLYRDDLTAIGPSPLVKETKINFDINGKVVVLIDDVLFTGRTIRAALDEIMDFGRPERVELLVLVDRGHRELPIRADFVGKNIPTAENESVEVRLQESDAKDEAVIARAE
ncbi:MAG: bifunctional pyr operon transcriptional regulator/uracil phosphoribosyltransferase PyrR [Candidatus Omnitrophica bacterium]|nr:bifunctional pyr operon transcriptional regulator/uracil phosphoribosyltransferase PyrR [Candidatus Omnitrophota bacterium]